MNKLQNYLCFLLFILLAFAMPSNAQVTVGSATPPAKATILQLKQWTPSDPLTDNSNADKGFGLPRVKLEELTSLKPFLDPAASGYKKEALLHQGMMVYNMTDDNAKGLKPGVYIWDGTSFWVKQDSESQDFSLSFELDGVEFEEDEIIFSSGRSSIPFSSKELKIKWGPSQEVCELIWVSDTETAISWQSPNPLPGVTNTGGSHTLTLEPKKFTEAQLKVDPFLVKTTTLIVKIQNTDGNVLTKNITIRQVHDAFYIKGIKDGMYMQMGRPYKVNIATNFDWTMTQSGDVSIIKSTDIPATGVTDEDGADYTIELWDTPVNEGKSFTFTFKGPAGIVLDLPIQIKATKEYANAYMTTPKKAIEIPIKQAYIAWKNDLDVDLTLDNGKMTTELVWQDEQDLISSVAFKNDGTLGLERSIVVTPKTDADRIGSALVALKIDGEIAWSWHVWVTDYVPHTQPTAHGFVEVDGVYPDGTKARVYRREGITPRNYTLMDRDLGAKSGAPRPGSTYKDNLEMLGYLYQWGRKDPLPPLGEMPDDLRPGVPGDIPYKGRPLYGLNSSVVLNPQDGLISADVPTNIRLNVVNTIKKPMTFYKGSPTNDNDWYSAELDVINTELWLADGKYKGLYDPCPMGWRVPVSTYAPKGIFNGEIVNGVGNVKLLTIILTSPAQSYGYMPANASINFVDGSYLLKVGSSDVRSWLWSADLANDAFSNTTWANINISDMNITTRSIQLVGWGLNARSRGFNVRCVADNADQLVELY